jgi:hypothetical protein
MGGAAVHSLRPSLVPRTTRHQALVTFSCAGSAGLAAVPLAGVRQPGGALTAAVLALGAGAAVTNVTAARESFPDWWASPQSPGRAVLVGTCAAAALAALPHLLFAAGGAMGRAASRRLGGPAPAWGAAATAAAGLGVVAGGWLLGRRARHELCVRGDEPDPALRRATDDRFVSGGPRSAVAYDTLGREGRRFVSFRTTAREIASLVPHAQEPVRVFVGVQSADTLQERVRLAVEDLRTLGGLQRSTLLLVAPAGTGYADHVAVDAVESLTGGDCATVVVQYGLLPSMLSLDRVGLGARSARAVLDALLALPGYDPTVVVYGESLGARVAREALRAEPSLIPPRPGVDVVVGVGTPGGARRWPSDAVRIDRAEQVGAEPARLWLLDHDADPVALWDAALAWRRPRWLRRPRGRNVPERMGWLPVLTWWQVLFDLAFAAQQQSGEFASVGHDYRADLPGVMAAALGRRDVDLAVVTALLQDRELRRDRTLGIIGPGGVAAGPRR